MVQTDKAFAAQLGLAHVTQMSDASGFLAMGFEGWREGWANEAYILQESRVETTLPETDLFAGIV